MGVSSPDFKALAMTGDETNKFLAHDRPDHATVFIWVFAVSSIWHYASSSSEISRYWLQYDSLVTPLIFLSIATAFVAAIYPNKTWALITFSVGQMIAIGLRFPYVADHLVMELFLNLSIVASFCYLAIAHKTLRVSTSQIFDLFSPVGRWLLIIMYFFGTFHKINPGFMSLESSCAVPFLAGFPLPDALLAQEWMQWTAVYGTLIAEFVAMLLLLSPRTKYVGMLLGMSFHFVIGISNFGTMAHFSAFAMALHALFLPSSFGGRIAGRAFVPRFLKNADTLKIFTIALIAFIMRSRIGYYLRAIRDDAIAAQAMGVDIVRYKVFAFMVSSGLAGMAGAFYGHSIGLISPIMGDFNEMAMIIIFVVIGGMRTQAGPIIGAISIRYLMEVLREYAEIRIVLLSAIVIVIVRFFNGGIMEFFKQARKWIRRKEAVSAF